MSDLIPDLIALAGLVMLGAGVYLSIGLQVALIVIGCLLLLLGVFTAKGASNVTK